MRAKSKKRSARRQPKQPRARHTVEAILDAVVKVLKRGGMEAVTTNRIAEAAGVSVGSVYQYFPDKRAIFSALHDRHVQQIGSTIERTLVEHAESSLEELLRALVGALVDAHTHDPELYELLDHEVPHGAGSARHLEGRMRGALRLALSARATELAHPRDLDTSLFVASHMLDALCHGAALRRPARLSLGKAKEETLRAILAYLCS